MESGFMFIRKFNEVQSATNYAGIIDFPQMIVVGGQSDGKSSLLESIVGRSFLPRGDGIVTRTPIILQLNYCPPENGEWAEILHEGLAHTEKILFNDIEKHITAATVKLAGSEKGVVNKPITVKMFSESLHDLTLVDLPGLVEVAMNSQAVDIPRQIEALVKEYLDNPNAIILAVHQAAADIATSKALRMVMTADPEGKRTVLVLTKLDLVPTSADKSGLLSGKDLNAIQNMKVHRTIGVINRQNQMDHRTAEQKFFEDPRYKRMREQHGIDYLIKYLSERFREHIRSNLPSLRADIDNEISSYDEQIAALGERRSVNLNDPVDDEKAKKESDFVFGLIAKFSTFLSKSIDGDVNLKGDQVRGGAKLLTLFTKEYPAAMENIKALEGISDEQVRIHLINAGGAEAGIFPTAKAFRNIVKDEMTRMEEECRKCAQSAHKEMLSIRNDAAARELEDVRKQYPKLHESICMVVKIYLDKLLKTTLKRASECVAIHLDYINVNNPAFTTAKENAQRRAAEVPRVASVLPPATSALLIPRQLSDQRDDKDVDITKELVSGYFGVVRMTVIDCVPKVIMKFMVNKIKDNVQQELMKVLSQPGQFRPLLKEPESVASLRAELETKRSKFVEAAEKLGEFTSG